MISSEKNAAVSGKTRPFRLRVQNVRFTQLLIMLALLLITAPAAAQIDSRFSRGLASWMMGAVLTFVLISAAVAVSSTPRETRVAVLLAGLCLVMMLPARLMQRGWLEQMEAAVLTAFLTYVLCLVIRALFRVRQVSWDVIAASLCGYLLLGIIFAILYSFLLAVDPQAVVDSRQDGTTPAALHFGDQRTSAVLYFSFVTLTTLGYGDLTPVSDTARMITATEAVMGQLYLVVLVARLVGLHVAAGLPPPASPDD